MAGSQANGVIHSPYVTESFNIHHGLLEQSLIGPPEAQRSNGDFWGSCQLPALLDKDTRVVEHELACPQIFSTPLSSQARTGPGVGAGVPLVANLYRPPHRHGSVNLRSILS